MAAKQPRVQLPAGRETVSVKMMNPTSFGPIQMSRFMGPAAPGHKKPEWGCSLSFLLEHPSGRKLVFDLGIRKDPDNLAPKIVNYLPSTGYTIKSQNVADILANGGVKGEEIEAVIWSHWHWDHIGDPSTFPSTTDLIVGPGFKDAMLPGAPANPDSPILESDYTGRNLVEITYSDSDPKRTQIGSFPAYDYFGDGSFYLLDSPGHAIGHLCGLARTTPDPDSTFVLLGGDVCHYAGIFRPSEHLPIPDKITPHPCHSTDMNMSLCPGHAWEELQTSRGRKPTNTLFDMTFGGDIPLATKTMWKLQELDCLENVMVIIAHDLDIMNSVEHFPGALNEWKEKGWGERLHWAFLKDLEGYWKDKGLV
ncbi:metallo-beta-lactamase superfamily protein [Apodospora peruviana]|uniref:Metallo-beta-lactamase superfamily protein n=1 Tax=Apodospora peruviana TaxID=516989 RepID=A0AAE0LYV0_9PEZI|nr:metallo-beta-lactamase superfamily protein [Apodospora peruviana]